MATSAWQNMRPHMCPLEGADRRAHITEPVRTRTADPAAADRRGICVSVVMNVKTGGGRVLQHHKSVEDEIVLIQYQTGFFPLGTIVTCTSPRHV